MSSVTSLRLSRTPTILNLNRTKARSLSTASFRLSSTWEGRQASEHVTNSNDELNIQSSASSSGQKSRANDSGHDSATSEKDHGNQNEKAKKDHPEAPGPVIGMNDERGQVSLMIPLVRPVVDRNIERAFEVKQKANSGFKGKWSSLAELSSLYIGVIILQTSERTDALLLSDQSMVSSGNDS